MQFSARPSRSTFPGDGRDAVRRLSVARAISFSGSTAAYVALTSVVYEQTGSAVWVAITGLGVFGLTAALSPLAGSVGDRYDRRLVMLSSDLLGLGCFLAMVTVSDPDLLIALGLFAAIAATPLIPATGAALPALVADRDLPWANSVLAVSGATGALAGPLVGGVLVSLAGAPVVFAVNAASFALSAVLIASLPRRLTVPGARKEKHSAVLEGFVLLWRDRVIHCRTSALALVFLGIGLTLPAEVALADEFGVGPTGYGALLGFWGIGGLFGAVFAAQILAHSGERKVVLAMAAGVSLAFLAVAVAPFFATVLLAFAVGGACEGIWQVAQQVTLQRRAPTRACARVLAASEGLVQLCFAAPLVYAGFLVNWLGGRAVFGIALVPCASALFLLTGLREQAGGANLSASRV